MIPSEHLEQVWQTNETLKRVDVTFSGTEAWLTLFGSKTLDSDLGISIPNQGLYNATADKFAKENGVKINNNDGKQKLTHIKT